jgi:hypothetical protein
MANLIDPGGNFPVQDGIDPTTTVGTPVGYDLTQNLSDSMRLRPPWMAMAQAMSRVFYKEVELQRLALEQSRDHNVLGRSLKIATLKMMGLELQSNLIGDDSFDRLLSTVSLYLSAHGSADFVAYIGYCLGFAMELDTLWTSDYISFVPGPQSPSILDFPVGQAPPDGKGVFYPTSHVALLYEEFAVNAPNANDIAEFQDIFYRIAPINLVLAFIGTIVTGFIGPLFLGLQQYEVSLDTAIAELQPVGILSYQAATYERSVDFATCLPLFPNRIIPENMGVVPIDSGIDGAQALPNGIYWKPSIPIANSGFSLGGGYDVPSTNPVDSVETVTLSRPFNITYSFSFTSYEGALIAKTLTLELNSSGDPSSSSWIQSGVILTETFTRYDDNEFGFTVTTVYNGGSITSGAPPAGTDVVMLTFRPNNTENVVYMRGPDSVSIDIASMTQSVTSGVGDNGIYPIGSGFWVSWAVMTGDVITVFPGGITGSGAIDWLDFQIIQGATFPAPIPSTNPNPISSDRGLGPFFNISSPIAELVNKGAIDFGGLFDEVEQSFDLGRIQDSSIATIDLGSVPTTIIDQLQQTFAVDLGGLVVSQTSALGNFLNIGSSGALSLGSVADSTITASFNLGSVADQTQSALPLFLGLVSSIVTVQVSNLFNEISMGPVVTLGSLLPFVSAKTDLGSISDDPIEASQDLGGLLDPLFSNDVPTFQLPGYTSFEVNIAQDLGFITDAFDSFVDLGTLSGSALPSFDCGWLSQAPSGNTVVRFPLSSNIEFLDLDLGSITDTTVFSIDLGSTGAATLDEFLFNGGIAIIEGVSLIAVSPMPQVVDGTTIALASQPFLQPFGVFEIELVSPFNEWQSVASEELFRLVDFGSQGLFVFATPNGIQAVLNGAATTLPITEPIIRIGIIWSPTDTLFFVNGVEVDLGAEIVNLSTALMFGGNPSTETWIIQKIIALGGSTATQLPGASTLQSLTGGTFFQIKQNTSLDLGPIAGIGSGDYLDGDLGNLATAVTSIADLGGLV